MKTNKYQHIQNVFQRFSEGDSDMYVDVKIGKRGEIVIPAFVRKQFKLKEGGRSEWKSKETE